MRLFFIFFIPFNLVFSQVTREWVHRFNGTDNRFDIANSLRLDASSNVYVYGSSSSAGSSTDITAVKYNSSGTVLWTRLFNGYGNSVDQANGSWLDNSGNSYVCGFTADTNLTIKIVTLKYNSSGSLEWSDVCLPTSYTQAMGNAVTCTNTQDVITAGSLRKQNSTFDLVLLKYSPGGVLIDSTIFDMSIQSSESPFSICADNSGNTYVAGSVEQPGLPARILVIKFNSGLNVLWSRILSGSAAEADIPVQVIMDSQGKIIICGAVNNNTTGLDYGIFKLDTNSAVLSEYFYNGTGSNRDIPYAVTSDNFNNIYVTGSSRSADTLGSEDVLTLKLNSSGALQWSKRYNGAGGGIDYGTAIAVDSKGNVYAGGAADKHDNHLAYALLKYNAAGDLQWLEQYSGITYSEDFVYSVAVDNTHNVFLTGISFDSLSDYDITTIKYSQTIGISQLSSEIPAEPRLYDNYPNPFNPVTKIRFDIRQAGYSELNIYDVLGQKVTSLISSQLAPGVYETNWNASEMPSGIYFYTLITAAYSETKKMALIK